jgi:hypothetical protein
VGFDEHGSVRRDGLTRGFSILLSGARKVGMTSPS